MHRYADTEALGDKWAEARKLALTNTGTPLQFRYEIAAEVARLAYDFACIMKRQEINSEMMVKYLDMFEVMSHRLGILEGAYAHLIIVAHSDKSRDGKKNSEHES